MQRSYAQRSCRLVVWDPECYGVVERLSMKYAAIHKQLA